MGKQVYKLFSSCRIVQGVSRSVIVDFQRGKFHPIPHSLEDVFEDGVLDLDKYYSVADEEFQEILQQYLEFLLSHELIFHVEVHMLKNFVDINLDWDFPAIISNAVLDGKNDLRYINEDLLRQLQSLQCGFIQIRIFESFTIEELQRIATLIFRSDIKSVELVICEVTGFFDFISNIIHFVKSNPKIRSVIIHSCLENTVILRPEDNHGGIFGIRETLGSEHHCGNVDFSYFSSTIEHFTESQHHNTCLNRKISIDVDGNIKNCPSMSKSYGNIRDTKLIDVVNNPEFQKVWHIKKDEITKCKDCEFRHVCTDCRAYLENPDDQYSAPLKCGYNPYTCEWEEWSTNPLKQKAIEFYGMQDLVKKS